MTGVCGVVSGIIAGVLSTVISLVLCHRSHKATGVESKKMPQEYVASLKTFLGSSSFIEQKSFLKSFIKRIELNEPQVVIDYTMPLPINGLTATEEVLYIDGIWLPD